MAILRMPTTTATLLMGTAIQSHMAIVILDMATATDIGRIDIGDIGAIVTMDIGPTGIGDITTRVILVAKSAAHRRKSPGHEVGALSLRAMSAKERQ